MKSDKKKSAEAEVAAATKSSNKNLYLILGAFLAAVLIGGGIWYFSQPTKFDPAKQQVGNAKTPTEAYKMLYAAVKTKNTENIKAMMSENSLGFAEFVAGQQKKTVEEVLANGFTATTFQENLPPMRDERIKDNFGALEVQNKEKVWEDLPFVLENGSWKIAIGDMFKGTYQKPGIGQSVKEQEAANAVNNNMIPLTPANANNTNVEMIVPKNGGTLKNVPNIPQMKNTANPTMPKTNTAANTNK